MPAHVPRSLQPYYQQQSLEKREKRLRRAIAIMEPVEKLQAAAEDVRAVQLLLLKAEFELIRYSEEPNAKRIRNIELKRNHWQTISVEAILVQYSDK
jgi:hypothetical protein